VQSALILTSRTASGADHALLLTVGVGDEIIVKSGFASGYGGAGPNGFSGVLHLLSWHGVELDEVLVDRDIVDRLDASALTREDLELIKTSRRIRPRRLWEYICDDDDHPRDHNPWQWTELHVPMAIIDDRLAAAARDFWVDPDGTLMKGHRQLEELIREKAMVTIEEAAGGPAATYRFAFNGDRPRLSWPGISKSEHAGRSNLFMGALQAYRHVRAHRSDKGTKVDQLCELLLLNQLFRLETETIFTGGKVGGGDDGSVAR